MLRVSLALLIGSGLVLSNCRQPAQKVNRSDPTTATNGTPAGTTPAKTGTTSPGTTTPGSGTPPAGSNPTPTPVNGAIPTGPTTSEVKVAAGNVSFDLASAKPALTGATVTATLAVNAAAGAAPASITLSNVVVKTPAATGFVIYRPVLVLTENGKETQYPIGTNINVKIPKARAAPMGSVTSLTFDKISTGASIKLRFSALEPLADAVMDGIPNYRECKSPQSFKAVSDALQPCKACHATTFAYDFMDKDMATACGQNMKIIDKTLNANGATPAIPAGTHHGVNAGAVGTAINPWKTGEGL